MSDYIGIFYLQLHMYFIIDKKSCKNADLSVYFLNYDYLKFDFSHTFRNKEIE